ncbi:YidB family protein [Streptomyces sp. NPDC089424]|uniref:YidB family protein n=1 Tax=Streptomyces sp. NPDC089424 TaxID=3365917 RepID=UPI003813A1D5
MTSNDLGSLIGGLLGGGQGGSGKGGNILGALLGALTSGGGAGGAKAAGSSDNPLAGLLEMLARSGLADQAQSWVGTGGNQTVTGSQVAKALPDETLHHVAARAGVSPERAADEIAQVLPPTVDKLSPNGQLPTGSLEDIIKQQRL